MNNPPNQWKIKLAVVSDHDVFRAEIISLLNQEPDFEVKLEASDGPELLEKVKASVPDIILMDIRMPKMDGVKVTEIISSMMPHIKIIAYTQYDYEENIVTMFLLGVQSFIGKNDDVSELIKAIRIVSNGGVFLTETPSDIIKGSLKRLKEIKGQKSLIELSKSERQLLQHICTGLSSTEIATLMNKSPRTIEKYRTDLYLKFKVNSKVEFIKCCITLGFFKS
jgi:DNA-binding NarL/FixJ family response regulator